MTHYKNEFKSILNKSYKIELYDTTGTATDIVTEGNPITVSYESDGLYKPLKMSGATINALVDSPLLSLYTGTNHGIKVKLTNTTDGIIEWFGYLSPCCYSSEYASDNDAISFEAIDTLSSLENIKYVLANTVPEFRTFKELLLDILNLADPGKVINKIYTADALRFASADTTSIWSKLCVHESNFFDELKESMTCQEVLAEMLRYLGMTMIQWKDAYYIFDYKYLKAMYSNFSLYNRTTATTSTESVGSFLQNLYDIGISSNESSISIGDIFNKVSVIASFNKIGEIVPELFDEEDIVGANDSDPNAYTTEVVGDNTFLYAKCKSLENWNVSNYSANSLSEFNKEGSYKTAEGEPSVINWTDYVSAFCNYFYDGIKLAYDIPMLSMKNNKNILLKGGYLILDFDFKFSDHKYGLDSYAEDTDAKFSNESENELPSKSRMAAKLKIGGYFFNYKNEWELYSAYEARVAAGFYNGYLMADGWFSYNDGLLHTITAEEYNHYYLEDKFFAVHTNKYGEAIFKTWYNLDNSVSYKLDLANSVSGMLITLPSDVLFGEVEFDLFPSENIGWNVNPNSTDTTGWTLARYFHVKNITLRYTNNNFSYNIFTNDVDDSDMIYSNDIDPSFVKEADDVTLKINTYAKNINSLSSVAVRTVIGGVTSYDFLSSLYCRIEGGQFTPEQLLINKLVELYEMRTIQYSNCLNRTFTFLNRIYESTLDTTFLVDSMTIDYANEAATVNLISV